MTPSPPLNTVLILPDGDEEIMRGIFELLEELAKAGGIVRVRVLFPGVTWSVVIQDAVSNEIMKCIGILAVSLCAAAE